MELDNLFEVTVQQLIIKGMTYLSHYRSILMANTSMYMVTHYIRYMVSHDIRYKASIT